MSTLTLAYCKEIAGFVVDLAGVGAGDWSEKRAERVSGAAIVPHSIINCNLG